MPDALTPFSVLVVEDNADDEAVTLRALRRCDIAVSVRVAHDGEEARNVLASWAASRGRPISCSRTSRCPA